MATSARYLDFSLMRVNPSYQAYQLLHLTFVVAPLVSGLDKFFNLLTNWEMYLTPAIAHTLPITAHQFMLLVGIVEIVAAVVVAVRPLYGAYLVAAWLFCMGHHTGLLILKIHNPIATETISAPHSHGFLTKLT
jgi:hypothetical protein